MAIDKRVKKKFNIDVWRETMKIRVGRLEDRMKDAEIVILDFRRRFDLGDGPEEGSEQKKAQPRRARPF